MIHPWVKVSGCWNRYAKPEVVAGHHPPLLEMNNTRNNWCSDDRVSLGTDGMAVNSWWGD
jgi:hypothetical protein